MLDRKAHRGYQHTMDIRPITDAYAVAPQIDPHDIPHLLEAGIRTVICNRPDPENPVELQAAVLRAAVEASGMRFVDNPVIGAAMTLDNVRLQREAIDAAGGPVLAYCASGTRSAVMWALAEAGRQDTDQILAATARAGYPLDGLRPQVEALSGSGGGAG